MDEADRIESAHAVVREVPGELTRARAPAATVEPLRRLARVLEEHFAEEEEPEGWFDRLLASLPGESAALQDLRRQHGVFLVELGALVRESANPDDPEAFLAEVHRFANRLREHERAENALAAGRPHTG